MNKLWIGIGLLALLLIVGIGILWGSSVFFGDFSESVEEAGEMALAGNWFASGQKMKSIQEKWEMYRYFWASFTDHEPVEQVQVLFAQLELYQKQQLQTEFASACRALSHVVQAIQETHGLKWWSVL